MERNYGQCKATTAKGARCRREAERGGDGLCAYHVWLYVTRVEFYKPSGPNWSSRTANHQPTRRRKDG